jgi:hypothetical protein
MRTLETRRPLNAPPAVPPVTCRAFRPALRPCPPLAVPRPTQIPEEPKQKTGARGPSTRSPPPRVAATRRQDVVNRAAFAHRPHRCASDDRSRAAVKNPAFSGTLRRPRRLSLFPVLAEGACDG